MRQRVSYYGNRVVKRSVFKNKSCVQLPKLITFSFVKFSEKHDLHMETAFNLSLIYRASGNELMAKELLMKHCWV